MKNRFLLCLAVLGSEMARPALATTLIRMSLEQLSQASTAIVRGHVLSQESRWNPAHTRIVTFTTVAVAETLKGSPPGILVIEQLGGTVGNIRVHVSGSPHFLPQADYLLFLEPAGADTSKFLVVGMIQGAYRIYRDAATRQERVILSGGLYRGSQEAGAGLNMSGQSMPLSGFRQGVDSALRSPIVIPHGASIPLIIDSIEFRGAGRLSVVGRTTAEIYPNRLVMVPAGSPVEGIAQRVPEGWKIHWTELSIRGRRVEMNAWSEEPRVTTLRGRALVIQVR